MAENGKNITRGLVDLLFPPLCMSCRLPVSAQGLCAACITRKPAFDTARTLLAYDDKSRGAILALKHADRLDLVPGFARRLGRAGRTSFSDCDLIVPVPLHRWRLWQRRYNQSAELARWLAANSALAADPFVLMKSRSTPSQGAMASAKARRRNVQRAFRVPDPARVSGKRLLLLDDVLTTGATAEACARALKRAGAVRVHVLALARVVKASDVLI